MRKAIVIVVVVVAVVGVLIGADFGIKALAQTWVGKEMQTSLGLSERPKVSLGGFPFVPHLATGDFPSVSATATDFHAQGVSFAMVTLDLHGVRFSPTKLARGKDTVITIERGTGQATMTEDDLRSALRAAKFPLDVHLSGDHVVVPVDGLFSVDVTPKISKGKLVLKSGHLPVTVRLDLPKVAPGVHYTDIRIEDDRAILFFDLKNARLPVSSSSEPAPGAQPEVLVFAP